MRTLDGVIEMDVTTVTLGHDLNNPDNDRLKMFHCPLCGSPVLQYAGFVARLFPGMEPVVLPIIVRCTNVRRCTAKYLFRAIV